MHPFFFPFATNYLAHDLDWIFMFYMFENIKQHKSLLKLYFNGIKKTAFS